MSVGSTSICCTALWLVCCSGSREAREIQAVCDQIVRGFETRDLSTLPTLLTPDFKCTLAASGKVLDRTQFIQAMTAEAQRAIPPVHVRTKLVKYHVQADSAETGWAETTEYSVQGNAGSTHRLKYSQEFDSEFVRVGGKWLMRSVTYPSHADLLLDGERVTPDEMKRRLTR